MISANLFEDLEVFRALHLDPPHIMKSASWRSTFFARPLSMLRTANLGSWATSIVSSITSPFVESLSTEAASSGATARSQHRCHRRGIEPAPARHPRPYPRSYVPSAAERHRPRSSVRAARRARPTRLVSPSARYCCPAAAVRKPRSHADPRAQRRPWPSLGGQGSQPGARPSDPSVPTAATVAESGTGSAY